MAQNPVKMKKAQAEIDLVLGQSAPTYESIKSLEYVFNSFFRSLFPMINSFSLSELLLQVYTSDSR